MSNVKVSYLGITGIMFLVFVLSRMTPIFGQENQPPNPPVLVFPDPEAEIAVHREKFQIRAIDPNGDNLKFKIVVMQTQPPPPPPLKGRQGNVQVWVFDQTKDQAGWDKESYASGEVATFIVPENQRIPAGEYLWWALATDNDGQRWSLRSAQRKVKFVPNRAPSVPILIAPLDNEIVSPIPTFVFKADDEDGDKIQFELRLNNGEEPRVFLTEFVESGSETSYSIDETKALSSGQWVWKVKAIDERGEESEWSELRSLIVNQSPSPPTLIFPDENATVSSTPTLKVKSEDPDGDQVRFVIEVSKGSVVRTFETSFVDSGQEVSFDVPQEQALDAGTWTWKAKAVDIRGQESEFSAARSFIVNNPPSAPELVAPEANAVVLPTLTFQLKATDPDSDNLKFKIVIKQGGQIVAIFDQTQETTGWDKDEYASGEVANFTVPSNQRLAAGTYLWVAYAFDGKEWSEASSTRTILVNQVVSIPDLISPSEGAIVRPTPTFKMKAIDPDGDMVKFIVELKKGTETKRFETDYVQSGQEASLSVPSDQALSSGNWTWKAKAVDERGQESEFSSERNFVVNQVPNAPELVAPENNSLVTPTPSFKVKSTDPDSDNLKFKIVVKQGDQIVAVFDQTQEGTGWDKSEYAGGEEATFVVPSNQRLTAGTYLWLAYAFDGKEWSEASGVRMIIVNQLVNVPELISPAENAIVRPTPTFKVKAIDPDGDQVRFVIEVSKGSVVRTFETSFVDSGQEVSFDVPQEQALDAGTWTWKAKAVDIRGQESEFSAPRTFIVNRPPKVPELISPASSVSVSLTPTFKVKATDDDADRLKFKIVIKQNGQIVAVFDQTQEVKGWGKVDYSSGEEATFSPSNQALQAGNYKWLAYAFDGKEWSGASEEREMVVISVPLIRRGLRLVACPIIVTDDAKTVFGVDENKWAWYDPTQGYISYMSLEVGKGYWGRFAWDITPKIVGNLLPSQSFSIPLKKGWNLIGNPWLSDLIWNISDIKVKVGSQTKPLKDLQVNEGVEPYAWRWDGNKYRLVYDASIIPSEIDGSLPAWEGAWVYAHQDCELILPPPSQSKGRGTRDAGRVAKGNGWAMKLVAKVDDESGEAILGVSQGSRGLAIGLPPEPPEGSSNVQVLVLNNGAPLAVDVRNNAARQHVWDVVVKFGTREGGRGTRQKEVTMIWNGVGYVPKDVSLILVDLATGTRRYMRTQTEYRFVPNEGETERRFKVIAELGNERPLRIVGLKAIPMRGRGISIQFALTKPAQTQVEVLTLTGRKVAVLESGRNRLAGQQQIVWQGLGNNGEVLPTSAYLVRVIAQDDEGRKIQGTTIARLR